MKKKDLIALIDRVCSDDDEILFVEPNSIDYNLVYSPDISEKREVSVLGNTIHGRVLFGDFFK